MSTAAERSLPQRRSVGEIMAPLHIPPFDDSEPVRPLVSDARDLNSEKVEVDEEGKALFTEFVLDRIQKEEQVYLEEDIISFVKNYKNPTWAKAGYDLRQMADQFARTPERRRVQQRAAQMGVNVNYDQFRDLMSQLFAEGGVTGERIIVLFYFCSDVAINALRMGKDLFLQFLNWSLSFIVEHVCQWVYRHGGWGQVLRSKFKFVYTLCVWAGFSVGVVLIVRYFHRRYF